VIRRLVCDGGTPEAGRKPLRTPAIKMDICLRCRFGCLRVWLLSRLPDLWTDEFGLKWGFLVGEELRLE